MRYMKNRERCWELLARKWSNEATEAELQELQQLCRSFPELSYTDELLGGIRQVNKKDTTEAAVAAFMQQVAKDQEELEAEEEEPESITPAASRITWRIGLKWMAAAVVAGMIVIGGIRLLTNSTSNNRRNEIVTRNGSRTSIELPDGSTVKLNGGSKLVYEDGFGKSDRVVFLEGEAFFDVKADPAHPFIVNTGKLSVKVLGTAFNVNTYDDAVETVLIKGKIEVQLKNQEESRIVLKPLEKLTVSGNKYKAENKDEPTDSHVPKEIKYQVSTISRNEEINDFSETAWLNNKLAFKDETFASLKTRLERWYNVHIEIAGEQLKNEELTGVFQNENIMQALEALKVIAPFKYHQSNDTIFIQPK